jgi:mannose-6-phosphate isomerase-like protein (cupin superfamily)
MLASDKRPWGIWEEYLNEEGYRVKRIIVRQGKRLSLQKHAQRREYWVVVRGTGKVTVDDKVLAVSPGDSVFVPLGAVHRLENTGTGDLIVIETQIGVCLEDDIVRIEDDWKRPTPKAKR